MKWSREEEVMGQYGRLSLSPSISQSLSCTIKVLTPFEKWSWEMYIFIKKCHAYSFIFIMVHHSSLWWYITVWWFSNHWVKLFLILWIDGFQKSVINGLVQMSSFFWMIYFGLLTANSALTFVCWFLGFAMKGLKFLFSEKCLNEGDVNWRLALEITWH